MISAVANKPKFSLCRCLRPRKNFKIENYLHYEEAALNFPMEFNDIFQLFPIAGLDKFLKVINKEQEAVQSLQLKTDENVHESSPEARIEQTSQIIHEQNSYEEQDPDG